MQTVEIFYSSEIKIIYFSMGGNGGVNDIDLYTGLISEKPIPGGVVAETAAHILGEQFRRLRYCDRFWFENPTLHPSFTKGKIMWSLLHAFS